MHAGRVCRQGVCVHTLYVIIYTAPLARVDVELGVQGLVDALVLVQLHIILRNEPETATMYKMDVGHICSGFKTCFRPSIFGAWANHISNRDVWHHFEKGEQCNARVGTTRPPHLRSPPDAADVVLQWCMVEMVVRVQLPACQHVTRAAPGMQPCLAEQRVAHGAAQCHALMHSRAHQRMVSDM